MGDIHASTSFVSSQILFDLGTCKFLFNCLDWTLGCFEYVTESVFVGIVVFVCFPALEDWHSFNPCVLLEHCMQACSSLQSLWKQTF
jgi:hypothetical protein